MIRPLLGAVLLLAGCTSSANLIPRPSAGYDAVRVRETLHLSKGVLGAYIELRAGTVLLGDRALPFGETLYCGEVGIVDALVGRAGNMPFMCFALRDGMLVINADRGGGSHSANPIPPGAIELIRIP